MSTLSTRFNHHPGLKVIFLTEMWERFSYYSMRALLVLYLVNALGYQRHDALELYGIYTGLVYLTPPLGGYLADRYFGQRTSTIIGALLMLGGHLAMAVPSLLHFALGLLIIGSGFFKPNTTALVGQLYAQNDKRRDSAYTIFYMGINIGAFLAPLISGSLGEYIGWHWGFMCAGIGMMIGLLVFLRGQHLLGHAGLRPGRTQLDKTDGKIIFLMTSACAFIIYLFVRLWPIVSHAIATLPLSYKLVFGITILVSTFAIPRLIKTKQSSTPILTRQEIKALGTLFITALFVVVFWMSFEQAGGTLNLFADQSTDRHLLGTEIPASWFQAINPLAIMLMAPVFAILWTRLEQSPRTLPDSAKLAFGMIVVSLSFAVMAYAQQRAERFGLVGAQWLVIVYVLNTLGELMLSPIGLSMASKLAPARFVGGVVGMWFITMGIGSYLSGVLEDWLQGSGIPLYWFLVLSCAICGIGLLILTPFLQRLSQAPH